MARHYPVIEKEHMPQHKIILTHKGYGTIYYKLTGL